MDTKEIEKEIDAAIAKMSDADKEQLIRNDAFADTYELLKKYGLTCTQEEAQKAFEDMVSSHSEDIGPDFFDSIGAEMKKILANLASPM